MLIIYPLLPPSPANSRVCLSGLEPSHFDKVCSGAYVKMTNLLGIIYHCSVRELKYRDHSHSSSWYCETSAQGG